MASTLKLPIMPGKLESKVCRVVTRNPSVWIRPSGTSDTTVLIDKYPAKFASGKSNIALVDDATIAGLVATVCDSTGGLTAAKSS
jgi:hypothetical protein